MLKEAIEKIVELAGVKTVVSDVRFPTGKKAEPKEDEPIPGEFPDYLDD